MTIKRADKKQFLLWAKSSEWEKVKESLSNVVIKGFHSFEIIQCFLYSVFEHRYDVVKQFIDVGIDVNVIDPKTGQFALSMAALKVDDAMVKILVENGADVNLCSEAVDPALYILLDRAKKFCVAGLQSDDIVIEGRSMFMNVINIFLDNNVNLNLKNTTSNKTAIDWAVLLQWYELLKCFLDHGASVNECQQHGFDAIMIAMDWNDLKSFELLFGHSTVSLDTQKRVYFRTLELNKNLFTECATQYFKDEVVNNDSNLLAQTDKNNDIPIDQFSVAFIGCYKISVDATAQMCIQRGLNIFQNNVKPDKKYEDDIYKFWYSRADELAAIELIIKSDRIILQNDFDKDEFLTAFFNVGNETHIKMDWFGSPLEFIVVRIDAISISFTPVNIQEHDIAGVVWQKYDQLNA
jgi:ankyrin repeat protein